MFKGTYQLTEGQREPPQLNWAGEPIREGEGYGGRPENIPETWNRKTGGGCGERGGAGICGLDFKGTMRAPVRLLGVTGRTAQSLLRHR
jgi:hypothetical protein